MFGFRLSQFSLAFQILRQSQPEAFKVNLAVFGADFGEEVEKFLFCSSVKSMELKSNYSGWLGKVSILVSHI